MEPQTPVPVPVAIMLKTSHARLPAPRLGPPTPWSTEGMDGYDPKVVHVARGVTTHDFGATPVKQTRCTQCNLALNSRSARGVSPCPRCGLFASARHDPWKPQSRPGTWIGWVAGGATIGTAIGIVAIVLQSGAPRGTEQETGTVAPGESVQSNEQKPPIATAAGESTARPRERATPPKGSLADSVRIKLQSEEPIYLSTDGVLGPTLRKAMQEGPEIVERFLSKTTSATESVLNDTKHKDLARANSYLNSWVSDWFMKRFGDAGAPNRLTLELVGAKEGQQIEVTPHAEGALDESASNTEAIYLGTDARSRKVTTPIAGWDFQSTERPGEELRGGAECQRSLHSNISEGMMFLDGTNGSGAWVSGRETDVCDGTSANAEAIANAQIAEERRNVALLLRPGAGRGERDRSITFKVSMLHEAGLSITYACRALPGNGQQGSHTWSYGTDGAEWKAIAGGVVSGFTDEYRAVAVPVFHELDSEPVAYLRCTFSGSADGSAGTCIDNVVFASSDVSRWQVYLLPHWQSRLSEGLMDQVSTIVDVDVRFPADGSACSIPATIVVKPPHVIDRGLPFGAGALSQLAPRHPHLETIERRINDSPAVKQGNARLGGEKNWETAFLWFRQFAELGLVYDSTTFGGAERAQRITPLHEVLAGRKGNCLDLSLLMASALIRHDVNALLFFPKAHAFVGYQDGDRLRGLECTGLDSGHAKMSPAERKELVEWLEPEQRAFYDQLQGERDRQIFLHFAKASRIGDAEIRDMERKAKPHLEEYERTSEEIVSELKKKIERIQQSRQAQVQAVDSEHQERRNAKLEESQARVNQGELSLADANRTLKAVDEQHDSKLREIAEQWQQEDQAAIREAEKQVRAKRDRLVELLQQEALGNGIVSLNSMIEHLHYTPSITNDQLRRFPLPKSRIQESRDSR